MTEPKAAYFMNLYETDFYSWTQEQADCLRMGDLNALDLENLLEEIEAMGRSEKNGLKSHLRVLLTHLLKWEYQPGKNFGHSWRSTIAIQREEVTQIIEVNPGLKPHLAEITANAYRLARVKAEGETGMALKSFPEKCPWDFDKIIDADFFPE